MKSIYGYDVLNNKLVKESNLLPTEKESEKYSWLWAVNNKYTTNYHNKKTGKWILFLDRKTVDSIWLLIKEAIKKGYLWKAKVSPKTFSIMVYTKNYEDKIDIINVLDYLEKSKIKTNQSIIYYSINGHARNVVQRLYNNGKPWIYSSQTIRNQ